MSRRWPATATRRAMPRTHARSMQSRYVDGVVIRPLRAGDRDTVLAVFGRLGPESRRRRFGGAKTQLTAAELELLARVDAEHHVLVAYAEGDPRPAGLARLVRDGSDGGGRLRGRRRAARPRHRQGSRAGARRRRARRRHRRAPRDGRVRQRAGAVLARPSLAPPARDVARRRAPRRRGPRIDATLSARMWETRARYPGCRDWEDTSMSSQPEGALRRAVFLAVTLVGLVFVPLAGSAHQGKGGPAEILVLSNRADLVSGGDALVQINLPDKVAPSSVHVTLNGSDVTSAFAVRANGEYQGKVTGLAVGDNELVATMAKGPALHLTITNHPSGGPVFAGPQVQPWVCRTIAPTATTGLPRADARRAVQRGRRVHVRLHGRGHAHVQGVRPGRTTACRVDRDHDDRPGRNRAVHRAPRARRDGPRALRRRGALQPLRAVGAVGVAARLEPQGALPVRRRHGAVAHRTARRRTT